MPISTNLLGGLQVRPPQALYPDTFTTEPVSVVSRKKFKLIPVRPEDRLAWLHVGDGEPRLVCRSPCDSNEWLKPVEYLALLCCLRREGAIFQSPHGRTLVTNPVNGQYGYVCCNHTWRWSRKIFLIDRWYPSPRTGDWDS